MDVQDAQEYLTDLVRSASEQFHKIPGSAIFLRYVKSSYQNDPIRSAVELFLVLFAIRYLLAPKYSTKPNYVKLSDEVGERDVLLEAIADWGNLFRKSMTWSTSGHPSLSWGRQQRLKRQI